MLLSKKEKNPFIQRSIILLKNLIIKEEIRTPHLMI